MRSAVEFEQDHVIANQSMSVSYSDAPSRVTSKFRQFSQRFKFRLQYLAILVRSGKFETKLQTSMKDLRI